MVSWMGNTCHDWTKWLLTGKREYRISFIIFHRLLCYWAFLWSVQIHLHLGVIGLLDWTYISLRVGVIWIDLVGVLGLTSIPWTWVQQRSQLSSNTWLIREKTPRMASEEPKGCERWHNGRVFEQLNLSLRTFDGQIIKISKVQDKSNMEKMTGLSNLRDKWLVAILRCCLRLQWVWNDPYKKTCTNLARYCPLWREASWFWTK